MVEEVGGPGTAWTHPFQGTIATSDGEHVWAFRYSSEGKSLSAVRPGTSRGLKELYPDRERIQKASDDACLIVSEPIGDLPGAWLEVPELTCGRAGKGDDELLPFRPKPPGRAAAVPA